MNYYLIHSFWDGSLGKLNSQIASFLLLEVFLLKFLLIVKNNLHKFYNTYWKHRNKIEELFDKTGQHGFEPMNQSTKEWIIDEFVKWKEDSLEKELKELVG